MASPSPGSAPRAITIRHWLAFGLAILLAVGAIGSQLYANRPTAPVVADGAFLLVEQSTLLPLQGDVQLQRLGSTRFEAVVGEKPLQVGDRVRTGANGYASVLYFDGSTSSLDPNTEVVLQRFERDPANGATAIIVQQPLGTTWTRAEETGHPFSGVLLTSAAGRFFARGSQFLTAVAPEGTTSVTAIEGTVFGRAQNADAEILPGLATKVAPGEAIEAPVPAALVPTTLQVRIAGPVRALLTDARGRSVGYHPRAADAYVSQVPFARLIPGDDQVQTFSVPGPVEAYELTLTGTGNADVSVAVGVLRGGERSTPAAAQESAAAHSGEVLTTRFEWVDGQVRGLRHLTPATGAPATSAVAVLRNLPVALAVALPTAPTAAASEDIADAGPVVDPDPADVFASFDVPVVPPRPAVVAPALPDRPAVVSAPARPPAPEPAPPRPQVVSSSTRPADEEPLLVPTAAPTATAQVVVVTATPLPPTAVPPTPVPPTPLPPTPVPPTPEPTVPPALPTPVPTTAPVRGAAPRPTASGSRPAVAPTPTLVAPSAAGGGAVVPGAVAPGSAPTRCPTPTC